MLISQAGVFTCGHGPKGELGQKEGTTESPSLRKVDLTVDQFHEAKASINHVVLKMGSKIYGWGACRKGQLGLQTLSSRGKPPVAVWSPQELPFSSAEFAVGHDQTIMRNGNISVLGKNSRTIDALASSFRAMWLSIHWLDESGNIHSDGNNLHGQLFDYRIERPLQNERIQRFEVGSEHGLALTSCNRVFAWGWGEHGNCGVPKNESVTFDYLNLLYDGSLRVCYLAGGLATTFVVVEREITKQ